MLTPRSVSSGSVRVQSTGLADGYCWILTALRSNMTVTLVCKWWQTRFNPTEHMLVTCLLRKQRWVWMRQWGSNVSPMNSYVTKVSQQQPSAPFPKGPALGCQLSWLKLFLKQLWCTVCYFCLQVHITLCGTVVLQAFRSAPVCHVEAMWCMINYDQRSNSTN